MNERIMRYEETGDATFALPMEFVVRCARCGHSLVLEDGALCCALRDDMRHIVAEDDFCSHGEVTGRCGGRGGDAPTAQTA